MRLFTQHLYNPVSPRGTTPPPCMWQELRERLDRLSLGARRRRVQGTVDQPAGEGECSLNVVINGELARVRGIASNGRFRLDLPADERVRLVFVSTGHLPRIVEIRPTGTALGAAQLVHLHVALTPNGLFGGPRPEPLRERITLGHAGAPHMIEYDRAPRATREADLLPLLKRAS